MDKRGTEGAIFASANLWHILFTMAPPVMVAQLLQALYNVVDSYYVGKFSAEGLAALSIVYPIQFMTFALAVGTGIGVNTLMSKLYALDEHKRAYWAAGTGTVLAVIIWVGFSVLTALFLETFVRGSTDNPETARYGMIYGRLVCYGSLPIFLESIWTKVHQAGGNMRLPTVAQVTGSLVNIILDPILIWGWGIVPALGIAGAAYATLVGQVAAMLIVMRGGLKPPPRVCEMPTLTKEIYKLGIPSIIMYFLMTFYIVFLNMILGGFSDAAVTVLGLYYRLQSFFFIPLFAMHACIVPILSFNYARREYGRCRQMMRNITIVSLAFMTIGTACFLLIPRCLLNIFTPTEEVLRVGIPAFRIIGISFFPAVFSMTLPIFFQAVGQLAPSIWLSLTRHVFCLMTLFYLLSLIGLGWTWAAFPLAESITGGVGIILYYHHWRTLKLRAIS